MNFDAGNLRWEKLYQDEVTKSEIVGICLTAVIITFRC